MKKLTLQDLSMGLHCMKIDEKHAMNQWGLQIDCQMWGFGEHTITVKYLPHTITEDDMKFYTLNPHHIDFYEYVVDI